MNKKILKLGILTVAGAAIVAMKKSKKEKLVYSYPQTKVKKSDYKNTDKTQNMLYRSKWLRWSDHPMGNVSTSWK